MPIGTFLKGAEMNFFTHFSPPVLQNTGNCDIIKLKIITKRRSDCEKTITYNHHLDFIALFVYGLL